MSRVSFDSGWQFREQLNPFAELGRVTIPYTDVILPHDAMIGRTRDPGLHRGAGTAFFPGGVYEYRKVFELPEDLGDRRVIFEFEGIYRGAMVHVNDDYVGQRPSGYSRFLVDATDAVRPGGGNEIHVEARNHQDGRWYTGAGIYRDVWLHVLEPVHLSVDGIRIRTPDIEADRAIVEVEVTVVNASSGMRTVEVGTDITDPAGQLVASSSSTVTIPRGESAVTRHRVCVPTPMLWSVDTPQLYECATELRMNGAALEHRTTRFGIRRLQLDPISGLRINGETIKLRGACVHHDNGIIGAATIARAEERRVEILKAAGFNAIRSAHNPVSAAMLDACDRLGMLVLDEAFDMWTVGKTEFGYALDFPEWWERDLESMIAKDFNHPSVIMYSIGNEIPETGSRLGAVWGRRLAEKVRAIDDTRYVTNAINGMLAVMSDVIAMIQERPEVFAGAPLPGVDALGINTMMSDVGDMMNVIGSSEPVTNKTAESFGVLDVAGMNYLESRYETDAKLFPGRIILGTETFPTKIDRLWRLVLDNPHVIGDFTWTGWEYLGEVGIGRVRYPDDEEAGDSFSADYPWLVSGTGDIDITGYRRPASHYREIVFGLRSAPYIAVQRPDRYGQRVDAGPWTWSDSVASWSWDGFEGEPIKVEVYSDADDVELLVNGRSLGRHSAGPGRRFRAEFDTTLEPGTLTAVARRQGKETGRTSLSSAAGPVRIRAEADRARVRADTTDLAYVSITLVDGDGNISLADRTTTLEIDGPAVLQGMGSGDPASETGFTETAHSTFHGRALAAIRPTAAGLITITVSAPACPSTKITIEAR